MSETLKINDEVKNQTIVFVKEHVRLIESPVVVNIDNFSDTNIDFYSTPHEIYYDLLKNHKNKFKPQPKNIKPGHRCYARGVDELESWGDNLRSVTTYIVVIEYVTIEAETKTKNVWFVDEDSANSSFNDFVKQMEENEIYNRN